MKPAPKCSQSPQREEVSEDKGSRGCEFDSFPCKLVISHPRNLPKMSLKCV